MSAIRPSRRKLYPMPVEPIMRHPLALTMSSAAYGMLHRLCEHFWATELRDLPKDDDQLFAITRAHRPTWRRHRPAILQVFTDVRPELERYHSERERKATTLSFAAHKRHAKDRLQAARQSLPASAGAAGLPTVPVKAHYRHSERHRTTDTRKRFLDTA